MRRLLTLLPLLGLGCSNLYWETRFGKHGYVNSPAIVNSQPGVVTVSPMAAYPASPPGRPVMPFAMDPCGPTTAAPPTGGTFASSAPGCTIDELCQIMRRIEARQTRPASPLPMPKGTDPD